MTTLPTYEYGGQEAHHKHPAATRPTTRALSLAWALTAALTLTACSQSSSGTPTPTQGTTAETTTTSAKASTSSTASASPIADIDPCDLLTPDERAQLGGLGEGEREDLAGGIGCSWGASGSHRIGINLNDNLGIQDLKDPGGTGIDLTVNGRKARKIPGNDTAGTTDMCEFGLEIGPKTRALIVVVSTETEKSCQLADQAAQIFEPKLPKS